MTDFTRIRERLAACKPGYSLPQEFYNDAEVFEFDLHAIFYRQWFFAGVVAQLPEPGSFFTIEVGPSSVIVLRNKEGVVKAFHNSCRHRGSKICLTAQGKSSVLVCPYHQWSYDLDGNLIKATKHERDFDNAAHGLGEVHVEILEGTIYLCMGKVAPDFSVFRSQMEPMMAGHNLADAKIAADFTVVEKGNWKLVMENSRECYHCAVTHPELMITFLDNYDLASPYIQEKWKQWEALGLKNGPATGPGFRSMRLPMNETSKTISMDGNWVVKKPLGSVKEFADGSVRWFYFPNTFNHIMGDYAFLFQLLPIGPQETRVNMKFLVHKDAVEGVDYDVESLTRAWVDTNDQDWQLVENNQAGVNSIGYKPGPYHPKQERALIDFVAWYCGNAEAFLDGKDPRVTVGAVPQLS